MMRFFFVFFFSHFNNVLLERRMVQILKTLLWGKMFPKLIPHMLNVSATVVATICFNTKRRYLKDYVHKLGFSFQFDQTTQINICSQ